MSSSANVRRFFGQYLIDAGVVTHDQVEEALNLADVMNRRLGEYAVEAGFVDADTVDELRSEQYSRDVPMGELLVQYGHCEQEQLAEILTKQAREHVPLGAALVKLGHVAEEHKGVLLLAFHASVAASNGDPCAGIDNPDVSALVDGIPRVLRRLAGVPAIVRAREWPIGKHSLVVRASIDVADMQPMQIGLGSDSGQTAEIVAGLLGIEDGFCDPKRCGAAWAELLTVTCDYANVGPVMCDEECDEIISDMPTSGYAFDVVTPGGSGVLVISRK